MPADREVKRAAATVMARPRPLAGGTRGVSAWRRHSETVDGCGWLCLELTAPDGVRGEAWAPDSAALRHALDLELAANGPGPTPGTSECTIDGRLARGLVASATLDVRCRRHAVPLPLCLGGAVRDRIRVTLPIVVPAGDRARRDAALTREAGRIREAADALGISAFAVHDGAADLDLIVDAVTRIREAAGPSASLVLGLAGQLAPAAASALLGRVRGADLISVTDPCASVAMNVEAARDQLPALGLSTWRYPREALLACLASAPPAVLVLDPLLEGGPAAVRELAAIARVLQIDVSLTAAAGGAWLARICADLAAALPACHRPIELAAGWTIDRLRTFGVRGGSVVSSTTSALSSRGLPGDGPGGARDAVIQSVRS